MSKKEDKEISKIEQETQKFELSRRNFLGGSVALTAGLSLAGMAKMMEAKPAEAATKAPAAAKAPEAPPRPQMRSLSLDHGKCSGCHGCVYACGLHHENAVRPATSRIHVRRFYGMVDVPIICWHCVDAPCVAACPVTPTKALVKDEKTNIITLDPKLCLGASCALCFDACPPQYIRRHPDTALPIICDLCGGDPKCVPVCQEQAKESGEVLRTDPVIGGLHMSFREYTPQMLADDLMYNQCYPNLDGDNTKLRRI